MASASMAESSRSGLLRDLDNTQDDDADPYNLGSPAFAFGETRLERYTGSGDDGDDNMEELGFFGQASRSSAQQALNELGLIPSSPLRSSAPQPLILDDFDFDRPALNDAADSASSSPLKRRLEQHNEQAFDLDRELELEDEYGQDAERSASEEHDAIQEPYTRALIDNEELLEEEPTAFMSALPRASKEGRTCQVDNGPHTSSGTSAGVERLDALLRTTRSPQEEGRAFETRKALSAAIDLSTDDDLGIGGSTQHAQANDLQLGMNDIPRYISVGTASAILLDGSVARFERRKQLRSWKPKPVHYGAGVTGLLSRPVHQIVDRVHAMAAERVADAAEASDRPRRPKTKAGTQMWQERYRPTRFTELVGEERTHRDVLGWLKEWDACVYGRRADKKRMRERLEQSQQAVAAGGQFQKPFAQDKYMRPRERVLLLGGPAGMGKTTLAHVAAKACGYNVHELNASDDRSARTVEDRVRDALETKSLQSSLPTCLILDEVDGATGGSDTAQGSGGFVKALIKLIEGGGGAGNGNAGAGKRKKSRPLLRPIICVCNDPYAAPLRALRPYAKMVRLNRPSTPALLTRLRQICERENISADTAGLNLLIEMCQGDVRSCLNALQLLQADSRGVTVATLRGSSGGRSEGPIASALSAKDGNSSVNQVWQKLFRSQTARERDRQRGANKKRSKDGANAEEDAEMSHDVVSSVINSGEMDKILAGCFEHYPNLKLVDDGWWRFAKAHDWMYWFEHLNQRGWELGNHTEMWGYLPWSFVCWRLYFANTANDLPEYPRTDYQQYVKRTAFDEVSLEVISGLPPSTRTQFDRLSLVTELGPLLTPILTPDLKPINSQLIRAEEKATLSSVVAIMDHTNITFTLDKNEHGHSYYRFDPPLEIFSHFEGKRAVDSAAPVARFNVRQMLATEVRAKRLRDRQIASGSEGKGKAAESIVHSDKRRGAKGGDADAPVQQKQVPKVKVAVDFFGRPVAPKKDKSDARALAMPSALPSGILDKRRDKENQAPPFIKHVNGDQTDAVKVPHLATDHSTLQPESDDEIAPAAKRAKIKVFYHFHEGYSNAVRKPIKMSALLS